MLIDQFKIRTADDPIVVQLRPQGNSWEEGVEGKDADEMVLRLNSTDLVPHRTRAEIYQERWTPRMRGKRKQPRYTEHGHEQNHPERPVHKPIIMLETEFVRFQGPRPFLAMIIPEPELNPDVNRVANPFMGAVDSSIPFFEYARFDKAVGQYVVLKQTRKSDDLVNQLFFKMIFVIIDEDGDAKIADPDFFCDR